MPEVMYINPATHCAATPIPAANISISEIDSRHLWSVQASRKVSLSDFVRNCFNAQWQPGGTMLVLPEWRLLQLWPHKAYLMSEIPNLPENILEFKSILTDISHGFCELSIRGKNAFNFVSPYLSTNLYSSEISKTRHLRCRFGQYSILLWWDDVDDLRIIVDRSYAQSFRNYLLQLMQRHDWNSS